MHEQKSRSPYQIIVFLCVAILLVWCSWSLFSSLKGLWRYGEQEEKHLLLPLHNGDNQVVCHQPGLYLIVCEIPIQDNRTTVEGASVRLCNEAPIRQRFGSTVVKLKSSAPSSPILFTAQDSSHYYFAGRRVVALTGAIWSDSRLGFDIQMKSRVDHSVSPGDSDKYWLVKLGSNAINRVDNRFYRATKQLNEGEQITNSVCSVDWIVPEAYLDHCALPALLLDSPLGMVSSEEISSGEIITSRSLVLPKTGCEAIKFCESRNLLRSGD